MLGSGDRHQLNSRKNDSWNTKKMIKSLAVEEVQIHTLYIFCSFIPAFSLLLPAERLTAGSKHLFSPQEAI